MKADLEKRIVDLECRYSLQEATIETLSDVVAEQQAQLDGLTRQLGQLRGELSESLVDGAVGRTESDDNFP